MNYPQFGESELKLIFWSTEIPKYNMWNFKVVAAIGSLAKLSS
jgi:hypothetical protein